MTEPLRLDTSDLPPRPPPGDAPSSPAVPSLAALDPVAAAAARESLVRERYTRFEADIGRFDADARARLVRTAEVARRLHGDRLRLSGNPFFVQSLNVAHVLADLHLDEHTIEAGFLIDLIEDEIVKADELKKQVPAAAVDIAEKVARLSRHRFRKAATDVENFRRMLLVFAEDLRVLLVKIADRLCSMRTLQHLDPAKALEIAQETLDVYAPLANRLGLHAIKSELEDTGLRFTNPEAFKALRGLVNRKKGEREVIVQRFLSDLDALLVGAGIAKFEVSGRPKHFYSIWKKMERQGVAYDDLYDILAARVIVETVAECYHVLGLVHGHWKAIPGRFKDYISSPKPNGYKSLHTAIWVENGSERVEVQVRTREMHEVAEFGVAAHWVYKEGEAGKGAQGDLIDWLRAKLKEAVPPPAGAAAGDAASPPPATPAELRTDMFAEGDVFVFTPAGDVLKLPAGATPLDFAYAVHTKVGDRCVGAKINGKMAALDTALKNNDRVEVLTHPHARPRLGWLELAKTAKAREKIRRSLSEVEREAQRKAGEDELDRALKAKGLNLNKLQRDGLIDMAAQELSFRGFGELVTAIGQKRRANLVDEVIKRIAPDKAVADAPERPTLEKLLAKPIVRTDPAAGAAGKKSRGGGSGVLVDGIADMDVRFPACCSPVVGDPIAGYVTRGRGVTIHRADCERLRGVDAARLVDVRWSEGVERLPVRIRIDCHDRPGLLAGITDVFTQKKVNIGAASAVTNAQGTATVLITAQVRDTEELAALIDTIRRKKGVIDVRRTGEGGR